MQGHQVPQHPQVPQDTIDLSLSGSSMTFLRADGPDLPINEVVQLEDDSSSDSDASSVLNEDRARHLAIQSRCAKIGIFHRKSLPGSSIAGPSTIIMQPICIDRALVQEQLPKPTGLEIVPWRPVPDAIALQILPEVIAARRKSVELPPPPVLIISENGIVHSEINDAAVSATAPVQSNVLEGMMSGPVSSPEVQTEQIQPSPGIETGPKTATHRQKRKNMSLPVTVSNSDARTPLVQSSVRRSSRLSASNEGYCPVVTDKEPSKKCKNWLLQIDEETGQTGPISIGVLQGWGINCGVDPMDLTNDALMQAPSSSQDPDGSDE